MPSDADLVVRYSSILWSELVSAADPERQAEIDRGEIAYEFDSGNVVKRDDSNPYA